MSLVPALCLGMASVAQAVLPGTAFTLAWTHSVEHVRWEEDWLWQPDGLTLQQARVRAPGAGMDIPATAQWRGGVWAYDPGLPAVAMLTLARSDSVADYELCLPHCQPLSTWLGPPDPAQPSVTLWPCQTFSVAIPGALARPAHR